MRSFATTRLLTGAVALTLVAGCSQGSGSDAQTPDGGGGVATLAGGGPAAGGASGATSTGSGSGAAGAAGAGVGGVLGSAGGTQAGAGNAGTPVEPFSTDRDAFFGESRCQTSGVTFCDGFEAASIDPAWKQSGEGDVTIDAGQKARGASSAHFHTQGNGFAMLRLSKIFPMLEAKYYGRMFVRFDALPSAPTWAHWTIAEAAGSGDSSMIRVGGQLDPKMNRLGVGSDGGPSGDWTNLDQDPNDQPLAPPEDSWLCLEWLHNGTQDETKLWWDAVEHPSLATTAGSHGGSGSPYVMPQFESVWIGWWLYQANPSPSEYDIWIDEVAFGAERIGCVR